MKTAILFLIFNRPDTTRQVFDIIRKAKPARLYIAADGPRNGRGGEKEKCEETRAVLKSIDWECEVKTLFRDENLGCKLAVSSAIDWFFENEEEGIILEDDCLPDLTFFKYCEELLEYYREEEKIFMVSGDNFYSKSISNKWPSYGFVKIPHIWGWATWRRAWKHYDINMNGLEKYLSSETFINSWQKKVYQKYWSEMFRKTVSGEIDTWDFSWAYSIFINNGLCVVSKINLISNIGFGLGDRTLDNRDKRADMIKAAINFPIIKSEKIVYDNIADQYDMDRHFTNHYYVKKFFRKIGIYKFVKEIILFFR